MGCVLLCVCTTGMMERTALAFEQNSPRLSMYEIEMDLQHIPVIFGAS
jgi:hypothetical protein